MTTPEPPAGYTADELDREMYARMFGEYLAEPCDSCPATATHNQAGGQFCNEHTDWTKHAHARND